MHEYLKWIFAALVCVALSPFFYDLFIQTYENITVVVEYRNSTGYRYGLKEHTLTRNSGSSTGAVETAKNGSTKHLDTGGSEKNYRFSFLPGKMDSFRIVIYRGSVSCADTSFTFQPGYKFPQDDSGEFIINCPPLKTKK